MTTRYGFGDHQNTTDEGTEQYEDGHVDVSDKALKAAIESNPNSPPKVAVAARLLENTGYEVTQA